MAVDYLVARVSCRSGRWTRLRAYPFFFQTKAPLIPHSLSVREGEDAGGVNRPARLPPCDGVLWPTGPDTSRSEADAGRRAAVGDTDLVGSDEAAKVTLRYQECSGPQGRTHREGYTTHTGPRWDGDGNARRRRGRTASAPRRTSGCGLISDPIPAHERYE